jgi:D-alanyl-D-alanine carboxypeptidase
MDTAIRAITVKPANRISVAFAELLSGSAEAFAARKTSKARSSGMSRTRFRNASVLHHPAQVNAAKDVAKRGAASSRGIFLTSARSSSMSPAAPSPAITKRST